VLIDKGGKLQCSVDRIHINEGSLSKRAQRVSVLIGILESGHRPCRAEDQFGHGRRASLGSTTSRTRVSGRGITRLDASRVKLFVKARRDLFEASEHGNALWQPVEPCRNISRDWDALRPCLRAGCPQRTSRRIVPRKSPSWGRTPSSWRSNDLFYAVRQRQRPTDLLTGRTQTISIPNIQSEPSFLHLSATAPKFLDQEIQL
jgi:hypothetical protein